jgi:hypothetical protein
MIVVPTMVPTPASPHVHVMGLEMADVAMPSAAAMVIPVGAGRQRHGRERHETKNQGSPTKQCHDRSPIRLYMSELKHNPVTGLFPMGEKCK